MRSKLSSGTEDNSIMPKEERVLAKCPWCDFKITQADIEELVKEEILKHVRKHHRDKLIEFIRKLIREAVKV